jgi:predicted porin
VEIGDVTVKISGSVNGFYVYDSADEATATTEVAGGVASVNGSSSSVRNGLLPAFLKFDVTTNQGGWDVGAHFGLYPGINSVSHVNGANSPGAPVALATAGIDARQTFLTLGQPDYGELKIGRDIGIFGSDAILNDITLLGIGTPAGNVAPSNTSLGRIGVGYIYTDFLPQITYTTPSLGGAKLSVGVFQPLASLGGPSETNRAPGLQAKLTYGRDMGSLDLHLWASGLMQEHDADGGPEYSSQGFDVGAKVTVGPIAVTGYYYMASGLGTTALNLLDTDGAGNERDSRGFYAQALATLGKLSIGASYGVSLLDTANAADEAANPTLVESNSSIVGQVRYGLTAWMTPVVEFTHTESEAHNDNSAASDAVAVGSILFF